MAHDIWEGNMIYTGEMPWHKSGVRLDAGMTGIEVKENLNTSEVVLRDVYVYGMNGEVLRDSSHKATMRKKDNTILGIVGTDYTPVQDDAIIDMMDALRNAGLAEWETAGLLRDASRFFCMMSIPDGMLKLKTPNGKTDLVCQYLAVSHGHDGTMKLQFTPTNVRVVCQNTVSMARAEAKRNGVSFTIKHTQNADARIKAAIEAYKETIQFNQFFAGKAQAMIDAPFSAKDTEKLLASLFPVPKGKEDDIPAGVLKSRYEVSRLVVEGKGHQELGLVGTQWGVYQAVCEYFDWGRQTRGDKDKTEVEVKNKLWEGSQFVPLITAKKLEALTLIEQIAA